ncbi:MAG: PEP-CTERM sorting domain-containing protein [Sedimentisphaerales bacterium]|nr:PEP-CTERM sorting domain-containing protein [Sedimentisphaerales bacterium]
MMSVHVKNHCPYQAIVCLLLIGLVVPVFAADESGYSLLLQSSPVDGGSITPGNGVHKIQIGDQVKVVAVPSTGYRFLYWIGDVGEMGTAQTFVRMDSPKLVVAVFEREQFEKLPEVGIVGGAPSNSGGLVGSASSSSASSVSPSGYHGDSSVTYIIENEIIKTPEPATLLLLGLGVVATRIRCKKQS